MKYILLTHKIYIVNFFLFMYNITQIKKQKSTVNGPEVKTRTKKKRSLGI